MRHGVTFDCDGSSCAATIDRGGDRVGLLLVSGGSEPRAGAHGWQARLAAALADTGATVLRFDRRGVGDSAGEDAGFEGSRSDILAATALLRRSCAAETPLIGIGNCDAASALALFGAHAGLRGAILLNPWTAAERSDDMPPVAAIRARYLRRLLDPAAWLRLATGRVDLGRAARGLAAAVGPATGTPLATRMRTALAAEPFRAEAILAARDATAAAFKAERMALPLTIIDTASHTFAERGDAGRLRDACLAAIERLR